MMLPQQQLPSKISSRMGKGTNETVFGNLVYIFMRDLNMQFSEILKLPIPMANSLVKNWEKQRKEEERQSKKKK